MPIIGQNMQRAYADFFFQHKYYLFFNLLPLCNNKLYKISKQYFIQFHHVTVSSLTFVLSFNSLQSA